MPHYAAGSRCLAGGAGSAFGSDVKKFSMALVRQRYQSDGGAERFVSRLMSLLHNTGVNVSLVTRSWGQDSSQPVLRCNPFYLGSLWRDAGFAFSVCRVLKKQKFDLVQSHERIPCCDIYRAGDGVHREWLKQRRRALGRWGKLRLALNPYHYYVRFAEKRLFNSARLRAVICNSYRVKQEINHYFAFPENKLHVIYNGVDSTQFHPDLQRFRASIRDHYAIPPDAMLFLFVGSGFERKGIPILLEVMTQFPDSTHLLVVGRDKNLPRFIILAETLMLKDRVHFTGAQQDVRPYYGAADAFVLPTLYDPFPNVVLEALATGLPVITSTQCGAAEIIEKNNCGLVCDALDKGGWVEAMKTMSGSEYRRAAGGAARKVAETLSEENMGKQLLPLYENLLSR